MALSAFGGGLHEFLNRPETEQRVTMLMARKAEAWRVEQLAKIFGG